MSAILIEVACLSSVSDGKQSPINLASHQPSTQAKEVGVLALICALRLLAFPLANQIQASPGTEAAFAANVVKVMAARVEPFLLVISSVVFAYLAVMQLARRKIARVVLDAAGTLFGFLLLLQFCKINLLLMAKAGPSSVLLVDVIIYVFYFALVWGWLFWRFDAAEAEEAGLLIALDSEPPPITMFSYYHAMLEAVMHPARLLSSRGLSKRARLLVVFRNIMILDMYAIVLGRFYQLVQNSI